MHLSAITSQAPAAMSAAGAIHVPPQAITPGADRYSARFSCVTPPVGMNLFVLQGVSPDSKMTQIVKGVIPYAVVMGIEMLILCFVPGLATWLPSVVK